MIWTVAARETISKLIDSCGGAMVGDWVVKICSAITAGNPAAIEAAMADPSGAGIAGLVLLAGTAMVNKKRDGGAEDERKAEIAALGEETTACGDRVEELIDLFTRFADKEDFILARLPGYEKADLAKWVADEVKKEIAPLLPEGAEAIDWDSVRIYLDNNSRVLDELHTIATQTQADVAEIKDGQQVTHEKLAVMHEEMSASLNAILDRQGSEIRAIPADSGPPAGHKPLSDEDQATLDEAKPSADVLTLLLIAVAEGDEDGAARLVPEVERLTNQRRTTEDFLLSRAQGDLNFNAGRFDEAVPFYRAADKARPNDMGVMNSLAQSLMWSKRNPDFGKALLEADSLMTRVVEMLEIENGEET